MFVFLPLLALVMKLLYWRPKRYYVEHLLFLVHNHAFVFLALAMLACPEMIPVVGDHLGPARIRGLDLHGLVHVSRHAQRTTSSAAASRVAKYFAVGFSYVSAALDRAGAHRHLTAP